VKFLIVSSLLLLTGCASNCTSHCVAGFGPGNSAFELMANHYNSMDPCQAKDIKLRPSYCGASKNKTYYINKGVGNTVVVRQQ
jgi:hypothetical protein